MAQALLTIDELGSHAAVTRTSSGGWVVPARITRVGIFRYVIDGVPVRVLRLPEDVFANESLATLARCPVTVFHPGEREVTPDNYRRVNVGQLEAPEVVADTYVAAKLVIQDAETGKRIDPSYQGPDALRDISAGYRALFALQPGVERAASPELQDPKGYLSGVDKTYGPYDRKHVSIRYNHVSLGPKGWGRAGGDVGITLDGDYIRGMDSLFNDDASATVTPAVASAAVVVPVIATVTIDSLQAQLTLQTARADRAQAQADVLTSLLAAKPAPAAVVTVDHVAVAARAALVADALLLDPSLKCDGLTDAQVMSAAALKIDASIVTDGKSKDYISGAFGMAVKHRKGVVASHTKAASVARTPIVTDAAADPLAVAQAASFASYAKA